MLNAASIAPDAEFRRTLVDVVVPVSVPVAVSRLTVLVGVFTITEPVAVVRPKEAPPGVLLIVNVVASLITAT